MTSVKSRHRPRGSGALMVATMVVAFCATNVSADDSRYSLGTIQYDEKLEIVAGSQSTTLLGFYNIDGTVPVRLEVFFAEAPQGWEVHLSCPGSESGLSGTDRLSLSANPSEPYAESPDCLLPGQRVAYLPGRGYVCADIVEIEVSVPEDEAYSEEAALSVGAIATWDEGAAPAQERTFQYRVSVLPDSSSQTTGGLHRAVLLGVGALVLLLAGVVVVKRLAK